MPPMKRMLVLLLLCSVSVTGVAQDRDIMSGLGKAKWNPTRSHEVWLLSIIEKAGFECRRLDTVTVNGFKDGLITRYAIWCENKLGHAYGFFELQYREEHLDWCITGTLGGEMKEVCMDPNAGKITS